MRVAVSPRRRGTARAGCTAPVWAGNFVARYRFTAQARNGACGLHRARVGGKVCCALPFHRAGAERRGRGCVARCHFTAQARNGACGLLRARVGGKVCCALPFSRHRRGTARAGCTAPAWAGNFVARYRFTAQARNGACGLHRARVGGKFCCALPFHRQRQGTALYIYISNTIFAYFRSFVKCFFDILELFFKKCK